MKLEKIKWNSKEYLELLKLREELFRKPFELHYTEEEIKNEQFDISLAATVDGKAVGYLSLRKRGENVAQLRQMVVDPTCQGKGVGRKLVLYAEEVALEQGFKEIQLESREESIGFYHRLGYEAFGEMYFLKTVMHQRMTKSLL